MDRKWWTLIAVCIGTFMLLIDVTIVNVALPDIQIALKSSFSDLQWVVDAYSLMLAALLLTTGSLADLFGRRRIFAIGLCIFTVSSLMSGLATTPLFLNLARGAQGIGAAAMFSTSLALLASSFRGRERGMAFGVWGTITGLAVAIGPVVGGALTTGFGWRWIFLVNVPIGVVGVIVTLLRVEESRQPGATRPDWIGALTFSGALAALVYALIQGESKGWASTEIVACLVGAGVLLILFLIAELVQKAPMFDLSLFRNPTFSGGSIVAFSLSAGMFALLLYLTLYLQDVLGYSALHTGLRLLFLSGGILLTSTLAGRLTTRVPISLLIGPGLVLVGVGLILMRGLNAASGWEHLVPGFIVSGAGVGLINPPLASTAVGVVEPARAGMASGINSTFRQVGIATGIAGLGAIFSHSVRAKILSLLAVTVGLGQPEAHAVAANVAQGSGVGAAITATPPALRPAVIHAVRVAFVGGLNEVFLIAALVSFAAAALSLVLIRNKDFEASAAYQGRAGPPPTGATEPPASPADPAPPAGPDGAVSQTGAPAADPAGADRPLTIPEALAPPVEDEPPATTADQPPPPGPGVVVVPGPEDGVSGGPGVVVVPGQDDGVSGGPGVVVVPGPDDGVSGGPGVVVVPGPEDGVSGGPGVVVVPGQDDGVSGGPGVVVVPGPDDGVSGGPGVVVVPAPDEGVSGGPGVIVVPGPDEGVSGGPGVIVVPGPDEGVSSGPDVVTVPAHDGGRSSAPAAVGDGAPAGWPAVTPDNGRHLQAARVESSVASLTDRSHAVALAAEQALVDCSAYIERILARQHEAERAGAEGLGGRSIELAADRAAALRDRLNQLGEERRRLVTVLREHTDAVEQHDRAAHEQTRLAGLHSERAGEARQAVYGLIAALSALTTAARAEAEGGAEPGAERGAGVTHGADGAAVNRLAH